MASTDTRLNECWDVIRRAMPAALADANNAIVLLQKYVDAYPQGNQLGDILGLGKRSDKSAAETQRRQAVRCALLIDLVVLNRPAALAPSYLARYQNDALALLNRRLVGNLPLFDPSPLRGIWDPAHFSDPAKRAGDYDAKAGGAPTPFRYIVFGMMNTKPVAGTSYLQILADPTLVRAYFLSTSVIGGNKISTYYPYGLILKVPQDNIVSTRERDQATRNYNTRMALDGETPQMTDLRSNDLRANVRAVTSRFPIRTPDDILNATTGTGGMTGYNEITVLGSFGGKEIDPVGFFKKVNAAGNNYIRKDSGQPYVTDEIDRLLAKSPLPVIRLLDTTGLDAPLAKPAKK